GWGRGGAGRKAPPITAPLRNAANAVMERPTDMPGGPTAANAGKTTLAVMFAVKMKLTASRNPLTAVSARSPTGRRSAGGIGLALTRLQAQEPDNEIVFFRLDL